MNWYRIQTWKTWQQLLESYFPNAINNINGEEFIPLSKSVTLNNALIQDYYNVPDVGAVIVLVDSDNSLYQVVVEPEFYQVGEQISGIITHSQGKWWAF